MAKFITSSLMRKVVFFFLVLATIQTVSIGYLAYRSSREAVEKAVTSALENANNQRARQVAEFLEETVTDLSLLVENSLVRVAFELLSFYATDSDAAKYEKTISLDSQEYNQVVAEITPLFKLWIELFEGRKGYHDLLVVVGKDKGRIVYTQKRLADRGEDLTGNTMKESAVSRLWQQVAKTQKSAIVDFSYYQPADGPAMFVGYPVFAEKKFCGMLAVRIGTEFFDAVMKETGFTGRTGEAFIVGEDFLMRSNARFSPNSMLKQKAVAPYTKEALQGKSGNGTVTDYRGTPALGAWTPVTDKGTGDRWIPFNWAVVGKMDTSEAFEAVTSLGYTVVVIAGLTGILVAVIAFLLARSVAKPITALAARADLISGGDLSVDIPNSERGDEIGVLAQSFDKMLQSLRSQTSNMLETVAVLSSSATEISSTAAQFAQSTSKTSSTISETTATVEQVKQAARLANDKAKHVAETSQQAVAVSESGRTATHDTVQKMRLIKDQMDSVAETVVKLSEQSQTIEAIIGSVQDLADQSNLLAVNASIEAARAGEQGKGFAVVAHEIKSLADQSRGATEQIRLILEETRKWVSAVVMATEQGSKAVDSGVEQSSLAGESIERLTQTVTASAQAASVIDATSEQQVTGVDQVALAMTNLNQAMRENKDGASGLEGAARKLSELGARLTSLVAQYRV